MSSPDSAELIHRFATATGGAGDDGLRLSSWIDAAWERLADFCQAQRVEAGDTVITAGNTEQTLYLVCRGSLEVAYVARPALTMSIVSRVPAGGVVGEQSFFDASPRSANVWAMEDSELLRLEWRDFERLAVNDARLGFEFCSALGGLLARRLRTTTARMGP